ncbi:MAG: hypothetical protein ACHQK8_09215, partial [Bacteroidia bacterium]
MKFSGRYKFRLFFYAILLSGTSCTLLDTTPVMVPAYIYVPAIGFHTNKNSFKDEGDSSSKFVDIWIYSNGKSLGNIGVINTNYYFKPALIPIQASGMTEIEFDAGIAKSGQSDTRIAYPFTERQVFMRNLTPNSVDTFYPVFNYLQSMMPSYSVIDKNMDENFESGTSSTGALRQFTTNATYNTFGDTVLAIHDSSTVYPSIRLGKFSGNIVMQPASQFFEMNSTVSFTKESLQPSVASPVYLELDYKSDVSILVGMKATDANNVETFIPEFNSNPTTFWNKVYVCLDQDMNPTMTGTTFKMTIRIFKDAGTSPNIWIDNVKLV